MAFHSSFERCVSRVIYKKDWATARPAIMKVEARQFETPLGVSTLKSVLFLLAA